jgi:hypothetical protein
MRAVMFARQGEHANILPKPRHELSIAFIVKGDIVEIQRIFYGGQDYPKELPA